MIVDLCVTNYIYQSHNIQMISHQYSVTISIMQVETFAHSIDQSSTTVCYKSTLSFTYQYNSKHLSVVLYFLSVIKKDKEMTDVTQPFNKHSYCN